ncbi:hypothetical protein D3C79_561590 [compost metagenome]
MIRVIGVFLPHEGEDHVVGVEVAGWGKILVTLEFHALAQMESVLLAVLAHFPAFRQAGLQLDGAGFEIHQPVVDCRRTGVYGGARGKQLRVEPFRRAFGTINQRAGVRTAHHRQSQQSQRHRECFIFHPAIPSGYTRRLAVTRHS